MFKIVLSFAFFAFVVADESFNYQLCKNYNPANISACNVTDLCSLTGAEKDAAVDCLRKERGTTILTFKYMACDDNNYATCYNTNHCVDFALAKCRPCFIPPVFLKAKGCESFCEYETEDEIKENCHMYYDDY